MEVGFSKEISLFQLNNHPAPKQMIAPRSNLGSMSLGNFTMKPTAIMHIPSNSKPFAA